MKKCSILNSVGPSATFSPAALTRCATGSSLQARDLDHVVGELRRAPAHHRLDARQQLLAARTAW